MNFTRRKRLVAIAFILTGLSLMIYLILNLLGKNLNAFYTPEDFILDRVPVEERVRGGGIVLSNSVRYLNTEEAQVTFEVSDLRGHQLTVLYSGILPDLFAENEWVMFKGVWTKEKQFLANQVLAKHDENYRPPELKQLEKSSRLQERPQLDQSPTSRKKLSIDQSPTSRKKIQLDSSSSVREKLQLEQEPTVEKASQQPLQELSYDS